MSAGIGGPQSMRERNEPGYTPGSGDAGMGGGGTYTTPRGNGSMDPTIQDYENIFGPAARDIKMDLQRNKRHARWHLPDALRGSNPYLADRIDGLITDTTASPFTTIILPYKYIENVDAKIKWNAWSFDEGLASRVPYESAARTLTQTKRSYAGYTIRHGLAITMEHNFMMSEKGRQNFKHQLQQVVGSIQYTNDLDVHIALITAQSYAKERAEQFYTSSKTNHQIIREYIDLFGFMSKNPNAMDIMIEEAKAILRIWGADDPNFLLCNSKLTFQMTMIPEKTQYLTQGPDGARKLRAGPDISTYRGLKIINTRAFSMEEGAPPRDVLRRRVRVAEYYRIPYEEGIQDKTFSFYDESKDAWQNFQWKDLYRMSQLANKDQNGMDDDDDDDGQPSNWLISTPPQGAQPALLFSMGKDAHEAVQSAMYFARDMTDKFFWEGVLGIHFDDDDAWDGAFGNQAWLREDSKLTTAANAQDKMNALNDLVRPIMGLGKNPYSIEGGRIKRNPGNNDSAYRHINQGVVRSLYDYMTKTSRPKPTNSLWSQFTWDQERITEMISQILALDRSSDDDARATIVSRIQPIDAAAAETERVELVVIRPNIEHNMLGIVMGRGGLDDLGATFWGQTELSCYDDSMHGIWGMSYKYNEKAIVMNQKNLIRLWDVAYDGYNGGKDCTHVQWMDPSSVAKFREDTYEINKPYEGVSMMVMAFKDVKETDPWPSPIVFHDPLCKAPGATMPVDGESVNFIKTEPFRVFNRDSYLETYKNYYRDMPDFSKMHNTKNAGSASEENETQVCALAFQGTMRMLASPSSAMPPVEISGSGHHGIDYVGVASVRAGKGMRMGPVPSAQMIKIM